jgi:hypothetical protein
MPPMVLVAVIVWLVVVGACFIYALVCGLRTYRRVRAAQATIDGRIAVLQGEGLGTLNQRTAELNEKVVRMQAALDRLEHARAGLDVLTDSVSGATAVLLALRRIARR